MEFFTSVLANIAFNCIIGISIQTMGRPPSPSKSLGPGTTCQPSLSKLHLRTYSSQTWKYVGRMGSPVSQRIQPQSQRRRPRIRQRQPLSKSSRQRLSFRAAANFHFRRADYSWPLTRKRDFCDLPTMRWYWISIRSWHANEWNKAFINTPFSALIHSPNRFIWSCYSGAIRDKVHSTSKY